MKQKPKSLKSLISPARRRFLNQSGMISAGLIAASQIPTKLMAQFIPVGFLKKTATGGSGSGPSGEPGTLWTWGRNNIGQLGTSNTTDLSSPVQLAGSWSQVDTSSSLSAAIKTDATLWTWGANTSGGLGNGGTSAYSSPVQLAGSWSQASTGGVNSTLAIKTDGTLWVAGANSSGELGLGNTTTYSSPVQVSGSWLQVVISDATSLNASFQIASTATGIKTDNSLWLWGLNSVGELGQGNTTDQSSPVQVSGSWSSVSLGGLVFTGSSVAAIKTDATLWTWGANTSGALGLGDTTNRSSPVQVTGSWSQAFVGLNGFAGGIKTDGTLWVWGLNNLGQLGQNNITNYSSPVQVAGSWIAVSGGGGNTLALKTDNTLWVWGSNSNGQLGLGNTTNYSSPVQVPGSFVQVSAGGPSSFAIRKV